MAGLDPAIQTFQYQACLKVMFTYWLAREMVRSALGLQLIFQPECLLIAKGVAPFLQKNTV
jgi:hypothetical protein